MPERCIMCTKMKDAFNREHVFPDRIGGHLIIARVCVDCNSNLGRLVDHFLTNHFLIQIFRSEYRIRGEDGSVPPVFTHGVLADDLNQKVHILNDKDGALERVRLIMKKETFQTPEGHDRIKFTGDATDQSQFMQSVNKTLTRNSLPEMTPEEFMKNTQVETLDHPKVNVNITIDMFHYMRALAKISYELTWYWLGDTYIDDPQAAIIRDFIWNGTPDKNYPFIRSGLLTQEVKGHFLPSLHQGLLEVTADSITCTVFISDIFYADIQMSSNPAAYPQRFTLKLIENNVETGELHEETE